MLAVLSVVFAVLLFVAILGFLDLGRRLGVRWSSPGASTPMRGHVAVEGAVFALMGLLIAFTFSAAQGRLDTRRKLIVDEANAIETAYLRLDLLPAGAQPAMRDEFRTYVESRIAHSRKLFDRAAAASERERSLSSSRRIWEHAVAAVRNSDDPRAPLVLIPALNEMIDLETARTAAQHIHAPPAIFLLLVVLSFACALFAGLGMGRNEIRSNFYLVAFSTVLTVTVFVIADMEFPRAGLIRIDALDRLLVEARAAMN
jgi:hypothetical protein